MKDVDLHMEDAIMENGDAEVDELEDSESDGGSYHEGGTDEDDDMVGSDWDSDDPDV